MLRTAITLAVALTLSFVATNAQADDCTGRSVEHFRAEGAPQGLEVTWSEARSRWELHDGTRTHALADIPEHAHLAVFVAHDGKLAVVRTSAEHDLTNRVLIYNRRGRLLVRHDLTTLLGSDVGRTVVRSISHIDWYRRGSFIAPDTIELELRTGRKISIDLSP